MFITTRTHVTRHWRLLTIGSILLMLALVACGGGSTASSPPTPTPNPTAAPSPTAASNTQTYTGDGFTIDYPSNWKIDTSTAGQVIFGDPNTGAAMRINVVDNPSSGQTADSIVGATIQQFQSQYANLQQDSNVSNSAMVGGDTWTQQGATYDVTSNGQATNFTGIVLADGHPANSPTLKGFLIVYAAPSNTFDQVNNDIFQPMLQSFTFSS